MVELEIADVVAFLEVVWPIPSLRSALEKGGGSGDLDGC
jgi:hypothetical protein